MQEWIASASNPVEVLERDPERGAQTLLHLQVTTHAVLGAMAWEIGGILVDRGWLRLLGSGHERMRGLLAWNGVGEDAITDPLQGALIVAHDAVGGFFAINSGAFDGAPGSVHYFAPDSLEWESLEMPHSEFVQWALRGFLKGFYSDVRWTNWHMKVARLSGDEGISLYPPLWARGEPVRKRSRRVVAMTELWGMQRDVARQIANLPNGARVRLRSE